MRKQERKEGKGKGEQIREDERKGGGRGRRERGTTKMKGEEKKEEVLHGKATL